MTNIDLNSRKEYIKGDLWVIRNFLTEAELEFLNKEANDPADWYTTMRSSYGGNIKNKFITSVATYDENGVMILPHPGSVPKNTEWFAGPGGIDDRAKSVLIEHYVGCAALQSIFEVPLEDTPEDAIVNDWAMNWHYELDETGAKPTNPNEPERTASFLIYINDNFKGGEVKFKNYPEISIKPEPGMLINIPLTKEFEHKVTRVYDGNRHALYGNCWTKVEDRVLSTNETC